MPWPPPRASSGLLCKRACLGLASRAFRGDVQDSGACLSLHSGPLRGYFTGLEGMPWMCRGFITSWGCAMALPRCLPHSTGKCHFLASGTFLATRGHAMCFCPRGLPCDIGACYCPTPGASLARWGRFMGYPLGPFIRTVGAKNACRANKSI